MLQSVPQANRRGESVRVVSGTTSWENGPPVVKTGEVTRNEHMNRVHAAVLNDTVYPKHEATTCGDVAPVSRSEKRAHL